MPKLLPHKVRMYFLTERCQQYGYFYLAFSSLAYSFARCLLYGFIMSHLAQ